ncbi:hypothetical protein Tco_0720194 [Tanacetum coccineum]
MDITELFRKFKFICHSANPFKDFERSNVPRVKLSSFSESDDIFTSLQALSNLHYLFSGFMDYFWSRTDIAKISRKRLKPDNHEHGKRKSTQRAGRMLSKVNSGQLKSTFSQTWSTQKDKIQKY